MVPKEFSKVWRKDVRGLSGSRSSVTGCPQSDATFCPSTLLYLNSARRGTMPRRLLKEAGRLLFTVFKKMFIYSFER